MTHVAEKFERIGARAKVRTVPARPIHRFADDPRFQVDVGSDRRGEFFDLLVPEGTELQVLNLRPKEKHLLLFARTEEGKQRFLCGHDERHWFAAAIPEMTPVSTVRDAIAALKPEAVRDLDRGLRRKQRGRRRNPAYVRQGEWFFIPAPGLDADPSEISRAEPLTRGRGNPHIAEEAVRSGGNLVWVKGPLDPHLSEADYRRMLRRNPGRGEQGWRPRRRNATVYVRGRITHPDHATVVLKGWHRVEMNTENRAAARSSLAFLD